MTKEYMLIDSADKCYFIEAENLDEAIDTCCEDGDVSRSDIVDWMYV